MGNSDHKAKDAVISPDLKSRKLRETGNPRQGGLLESLRPTLNHDLPNMLVVLKGFLQMLSLEEGSRLSPSGQDYLRRLEGVTEKLQYTFGVLRRINKVSSSSVPVAETIPLLEFLNEVGAAARKLLPEMRIVIHPVLQVSQVTLPHALLQQAVLECVRLLATASNEQELHCQFTARQTSYHIELAIGAQGSTATGEHGGRGPSAVAHVSSAAEVDYNFFGPDQRLNLVLIEEIARTWGGRLATYSSAEQGKWVYLSVPGQPRDATPARTSHAD